MNKIKIRVIITSILILFFTSCHPNWYKPHGWSFRHMPKKGTAGFKLGWLHGCESGFGTMFLGQIGMTFYTWTRPQELITSNYDVEVLRVKYKKELPINWDNPAEVKKNLSDYKKIFWHAHMFCRHSALGTHQASAIKGTNVYEPPLAGQQRYVPGKHSIANIYSIHGHHSGQLVWW